MIIDEMRSHNYATEDVVQGQPILIRNIGSEES